MNTIYMAERDFPDKKVRNWHPKQVDEVLIKARELQDRFEIGQKEATWAVHPEYSNLPVVILLMTDTHYGSTRTQTDLINEHLDIVENTPNFYLVHNGDHTDNFNAALGKLTTGMYENPLPPQIVSRSWAEKLRVLDSDGKIGVMGFGNHNDFGFVAGQDWYDSFLGKFNCPIFTSGGLLHILFGEQHYEIAMTHKYWGYSKLNPTNACKRFLQFEYPFADVSFLGHTHQSEGLEFDLAGTQRIAVIGGTYKDDDEWARKSGIGGRGGSPGWALALWPDTKQMQLFRDIEIAEQWMIDMVFREESDNH